MGESYFHVLLCKPACPTQLVFTGLTHQLAWLITSGTSLKENVLWETQVFLNISDDATYIKLSIGETQF